jgi:hypothetical protein
LLETRILLQESAVKNRIWAACAAFLLALGITGTGAVAASAGTSDGPTPYTVTPTALVLPAGATFTDGQEVNIHFTVGDAQFAEDVHFEALNNQPYAEFIGESTLPWSSLIQGSSYCITWVQVGGYNEHFGEGDQAPVCYPEPTPTPTPTETSTPTPTPTETTSTPTPIPTETSTPEPTPTVAPERYEVGFYIYQKLDKDEPANWSNSGEQTFCESKPGSDWFTTLPCELPAEVCGDGWSYQQDLVGNWEYDGAFAWPMHLNYPNPGGIWPLYDSKHGDLATFVDVPECAVTPPTEVPPTEVPPTEVPPTEVPPTEVPPLTDTPDTEGEEPAVVILAPVAAESPADETDDESADDVQVLPPTAGEETAASSASGVLASTGTDLTTSVAASVAISALALGVIVIGLRWALDRRRANRGSE